MLVLPFGVVHVGTVLGRELGEVFSPPPGRPPQDGRWCRHSSGRARRWRRRRRWALRIAEQRADEVSGAHVVQQVGEQRLAEGIVAKVLDHAAAIGVRAGVTHSPASGSDNVSAAAAGSSRAHVRSINSSWVSTEKPPAGRAQASRAAGRESSRNKTCGALPPGLSVNQRPMPRIVTCKHAGVLLGHSLRSTPIGLGGIPTLARSSKLRSSPWLSYPQPNTRDRNNARLGTPGIQESC